MLRLARSGAPGAGARARSTEVDDAESDAYFASRPRGSQLGAWVSDQSAVIADRAVLEDGLARGDGAVRGPRGAPARRTGAATASRPEAIEFWQGRANRLHDRLRYTRDPSRPTGWRIDRLAP